VYYHGKHKTLKGECIADVVLAMSYRRVLYMSVQATTEAFLQVIRRGKENFALRRAIEFGRKDGGKDLF
jgi:hypothetical protein